MKKVTVSLDDETYETARMKAAEAGRSLSSLVRDVLRDLGSSHSEFERLYQQELRLREEITGFSVGKREPRDKLHERR